MGFLTDTVKRSQKRWQGVYVPEWIPAARWAVGGIAALILVLGVASNGLPFGGSAPESTPTPGFSVVPTESAAPLPEPQGTPGTPNDPGTGGPSAAPAPEGTVYLPGPDGGDPVAVPVAALEQARMALKAQFTGDYTGVIVPEGVPKPQVVNIRPKVVVGDPVYAEEGPGLYTITFPVDPDGKGGIRKSLQATTVILDQDTWMFSPAS